MNMNINIPPHPTPPHDQRNITSHPTPGGCWGGRLGSTLCASLRTRNACQGFTRATLCGNLEVKCCRPKPRRRLCGACAVETHVKIPQEPLYTEIYWENAAAQSEHPDQAPAFTPTVRTRQCRYTVWGQAPKRHQNTQAPRRAHGN